MRGLFKLILCVSLLLAASGANSLSAQCSVCTRTAQQLGEKPARGLNAGIIYLAFTPLILIGIIGYRVFRKGKSQDEAA